jgi:L-threonylcarbamoyladenylate synthase
MTDSTLVADLYDCSDPEGRAAGLDAAAAAIGAGKLVLLPTDTVTPAAVTGLLAAKNRGRAMPVPVLIGEASTLGGLVVNLPPVANDLAQAFWPGGLTLVLEHAPSLAWDLGDAEGTVAVRLPDDDLARDLLRHTGPLAVSSANRSGRPAATTAQEAVDQLGTHAAVVLDGGPRSAATPSTIVDCTGPVPRVLRVGVLTVDELRGVVPEIED